MIPIQANPYMTARLARQVSNAPEIVLERLLAAFSMQESSITQAQALMLHAAKSLSTSS